MVQKGGIFHPWQTLGTLLQSIYGASKGIELRWKGHGDDKVPLILLLFSPILNPKPSYPV